jgi:hypothetical protein
MSGSGSLNLTGLIEGSVQSGWGINATLGTWVIGPSASFFGRKYQGNAFSTYPTSFGSGYTAPTSFTGDAFGIQNGSLGKDIIVPLGYVSGSPLSGTATFANKTISSMGLTPGTYLYDWGNDSITLEIETPSSTPTPTPTSTPTSTPTPTATPVPSTPTPTPTPTNEPTTEFTVMIYESDSNVVMSGSGTLDLSGLTLVTSGAGPSMGGGLGVSTATFLCGANGQYYDTYSGFTTTPSNFGSGFGFPPTSTSGDIFGVVTQGAPPYFLYVPSGYTTGTQITGSQTFTGETFSSLGLVEGTYTYTWLGGSIDVVIGTAPETTTTPTPTPTSNSSGQGEWYFYSDEGALNTDPPLNPGNVIFLTSSGGNETFNPNRSSGTNQIYLNRYDDSGTDYGTQFNNLMVSGGTISIIQNGQTATFTTSTAYQFQYNSASNGFLMIPNTVNQTASTASSFVYGIPISITFGGDGPTPTPTSTPTPTPTNTPTPTPTATPTETPTPTPTPTATQTPTPTPNNVLTTSNLVLHLDPSNTSSYPGSGTTITDLSGNGRNGTMSNISHTSPYFTYNGSSSQISVADNALLEPGSGDWTIEVWVNQTVSGNDVVLGKFNPGGASANVGYSIRTLGTRFFAQFGSGSGSGATLIQDSVNYASTTTNNWYQIVYVFTNVAANTLQTFVNGVSVGSVSHSLASILNTSTGLYIGSYNNGEYAQWFDGKIGIVRLYNKSLTSSEVLGNYNADKSKYGLT